jgi:NHL repeat/Beta-propeller repeat
LVVTHVDGRNADPAPLATIPVTIPVDLATTPTGVALDSSGNIYAASKFGGGFDSITMYPAGSNSSSTASVTIIGNNTLLDTPTGIAVRPVVPSATPSPSPTASPTPTTAGIGVTNQNSVVVDAAGSNGNVTPSQYIAGAATQLSSPLGSVVGITFDSNGNIYVGGGKIKVYPAGSNGDAAPSAIINGTGQARGVALDSMGNVYVSNSFGNASPKSITVYPAGGNGSVAPLATISGSNTGLTLPEGIALDSSANIYVVNCPDTAAYSVTVYAAGSNGNVAPSATIAGANTGLSCPLGIALDSSANIYIANLTGGLGKFGSVTVYPAGSNGNVTPSATIVGSTNTELSEPNGIAVDSLGNIYVSNHGASSILVYPAGSNGDVAPIVNIGGPDTKIAGPVGIAVIPGTP